MSAVRPAELVEALFAPLRFTLDGRNYTVPDRSLAEWLTAVTDPAFDAVVPALLEPTDAAELYERLLDEDDPLTEEDLARVGEWVLETLGGRPWWEVRRGAAEALADWNGLDAWCAYSCGGLAVESLSLRRLINLVVLRINLLLEEEDREIWAARFAAPPPEATARLEERPEWHDDAIAAETAQMADQWASLSAGLPGGSPE